MQLVKNIHCSFEGRILRIAHTHTHTQSQSQSQSQNYFSTGGLPLFSLVAKTRETLNVYFFQLNTCSYCPYVTSSLTREWVSRLQLLLVLASAVILGSES
jgi:hypothetical protein